MRNPRLQGLPLNHPAWSHRQFRSLRAAGKRASSWSGSAGQESQLFRYTRGSARQNVDRVVDEQAKLSDRKRQI
jgi:hypothetical protein